MTFKPWLPDDEATAASDIHINPPSIPHFLYRGFTELGHGWLYVDIQPQDPADFFNHMLEKNWE